MKIATTGFHDGELAVQRRAGVAEDAARLEGMLGPVRLDGAARFLVQRDFAVITGRDAEGRLWTSPLRGEPGFLDATESTLDVHSGLDQDDPLVGMPARQPVGLIVIDFSLRRRVRINGLLTAAGAGGFTVDVDQAFGNCPSYISPEPDMADIATADTFFLGTVHPTRGADTSHKGGPPGFLHQDGDTLWWADLPGNNMFTSLGNLTVNPEAAILLAHPGTTLQLSGTATVEWVGTERRVRFRAVR